MAAELTKQVRDKARELGFDAVGIANAAAPPEEAHERYRAFLAEGLHGEMGYLAEHEGVLAQFGDQALTRRHR